MGYNKDANSDHIEDDAVNAAKIAADAVGSSEIATDAVDSDEIAPDAVEGSEIATDAVDSAEIAADAVGAPEIATDAVGAPEIAADAVDSSEIATDAVGSAEIATNAVGSSEVATDSLVAGDIATDAIGTLEIAPNAVTTNEIALDTIAANDIAPNAVGTSEIATDGVGSAEIATDAVGASEIAADAVDASEIAAGAVGASEIGFTLDEIPTPVAPVDMGGQDVTNVNKLTTNDEVNVGQNLITQSGHIYNAGTLNVDYDFQTYDHYKIADTSANPVTFTMPTGSVDLQGQTFEILRMGADPLTIDVAAGPTTVNGGASFVFAEDGESHTIQYDFGLDDWVIFDNKAASGGAGEIVSVYLATPQTLGAFSEDYIVYDEVEHDPDEIYDDVTGAFTIPTTGLWEFDVEGGWATAVDGKQYVQKLLSTNLGTVTQSATVADEDLAAAGQIVENDISITVALTAGDVVHVSAFSDVGVNTNLFDVGRRNRVTAKRIA